MQVSRIKITKQLLIISCLGYFILSILVYFRVGSGDILGSITQAWVQWAFGWFYCSRINFPIMGVIYFFNITVLVLLPIQVCMAFILREKRYVDVSCVCILVLMLTNPIVIPVLDKAKIIHWCGF